MTSILIVDDEPIICEILSQVLEAPSRRICIAGSCGEAREALAKVDCCDVAIVDKNLPDGSGVELARALKAADPLTEVLMMTAFPSMDSAIEAVELGAFDYLTKPFDDLTQVVMKVGNAEDKSSLRRERQRLHESLRQSEDRFRTLFESTPDAIVVYDAEERVIREVNQAAVRLYGRARDGLIGLSVDDVVGTLSSREVDSDFPLHRRDRGPDGASIDVEVAIGKFVVGGQGMILEVIRDVTDRLRQEEERDRLRDQLRQSEKMNSLGQLAGGIAHDFNNVITAMIVFGGFMAESLEAIPDLETRNEALSDLEQIRRASSHAASITRQLLAFSRKEMVRPEVLDLNDVVMNLASILRASLGTNVALSTQLSRGLWNTKVDPTQFEQVIINLAINGRDAMPNGGTVLIETRNVSNTSPAGVVARFVELAVTDTGSGIDQAVLENIFDPFFTTKGGKGTGLGLATVRSIVDGAGGSVSVSSQVGQGTTFTLRLPVTEEPRVPSFVPPHEAKPNREGHTILLVEDDDGVRRALYRVLRKAGYDVMEARSGEEAFAAYEAEPSRVSAMLIDVVLGGFSGEHLGREIRRRNPSLPIVFMTGYATREGAFDPAEFSGAPLLPKPFRDERLLLALASVLDERPKLPSGKPAPRDPSR